MRKWLHIVLVLMLAVSCGPRKIPRDDMEKIMADILLQDQQIKQDHKLRKEADTTLVYEGIFEAYDYDTDDFLYSLEYYLEDPARMEKLKENAYKLAAYADSIGSVFACETGTEKADQLRAFLDQLGAKGLRVNLDPANLVMVAHDDPVKAVYTLKDYIVHTHAKDGIVTDKTPHGWLEVPLGTGGVDWNNYLKALCDIGFNGYLTIEREVGEQPAEDIGMAVRFLKQKLSELSIPLG